jgi:hypothetical protein
MAEMAGVGLWIELGDMESGDLIYRSFTYLTRVKDVCGGMGCGLLFWLSFMEIFGECGEESSGDIDCELVFCFGFKVKLVGSGGA